MAPKRFWRWCEAMAELIASDRASINPTISEKPLAARRIVVTRARAQAGGLARKIAALGGEVMEFPTIEIQPPADYEAFDGAVSKIENYDWLIFTSVNSIEPFLARLKQAGKSAADMTHLKVAAIGSQTARQLQAAGIVVDVIPARYQAEGLLESLSAATMAGKRVLIPRAAKARDVLPDTLRQWGAGVDVVEAYRTAAPPVDIAAVRERLQRGDVDVISFTSSSTVSNFVRLFDGGKLSSIVGDAAIATIGPITARTVEDLGGQVAIMAQEFTVDGLVKAIVDYFSRKEFATDGLSVAGS